MHPFILTWDFYSAVRTSTEFFLIFPVSSSVCNTKIFIKKKYGVTGLDFKVDAINGKKWVKFAAIQQNSATLIYDLMTQGSINDVCDFALTTLTFGFIFK